MLSVANMNKVILSCRVPAALRRKVEIAAKHDHRTMSSWLEKVIAEAIDKPTRGK